MGKWPAVSDTNPMATLMGMHHYLCRILPTSIVNLPPYYPNLVGGFTFQTLANELTTSALLLDSSFQGQFLTDIRTSALTGSRILGLTYEKEGSVVVSYYPSILENFKFKYATYVAFVIIAYFVFYELFRWYVKEGLLDCVAETEKIK